MTCGVLSATYLPEVAPDQGWEHIDASNSAICNAGWNGRISEDLGQATRWNVSKWGSETRSRDGSEGLGLTDILRARVGVLASRGMRTRVAAAVARSGLYDPSSSLG
jgi:hypothetical protein